MKKIQKEILALLRENNCNVSDAILGKCSYAEYLSFHKDPDFKAGFVEAEKIRDDFVLEKCMQLIAEGDRTAITDYQKMIKQSDDANDAKRIKKEFMRVCIDLAETKSRCLKEYCQVFNASKNQSEKQYDAVVAEYNLVTPYERAKRKQKIHESSMSTLFDQGKLSEVDMYRRLLSKALYDSEQSEYPSERSKARADVISINQRLDDIKERERREAESDQSNLIDKLDAQLAGVSPDDIVALRDFYINTAKAIEKC